MAWPLLQKYALEDMKDFADSIALEKDLIKQWIEIGKKWKAELDELEALEPYKDPDTEKIRLEKISMKTENLKLLKEVIAGDMDNVKWYRGMMERIERGDFDG